MIEESDAETLAGGCLCGAVRFALTFPTEFCSHCHCASCRRAHGAAFVTWTSVPNERFTILAGEDLTWFASSAGVQRGFCGRCGSPMLYRSEEAGGRTYVAVAALLGPLDRAPDGHVSWEEHVGWIEGHASLPRTRAKTEEQLG